MNFYETTNGYLGQSHTRSYVWASDDYQARQLATEAFRQAARAEGYDDHYWAEIELRLLFSSSAPAFASWPNGDGFYEPLMMRIPPASPRKEK